MTDEEKKILFETLGQILENQRSILNHIGVVKSYDDTYYTNELITKTERIANSINIEDYY